MSPPSSLIVPQRTAEQRTGERTLDRSVDRSDRLMQSSSEELLFEGTIGEVVVECVGQAIRLLEASEQMDSQPKSSPVTENEEDDCSPPMLELLTPPATDPESPGSETIIGLIPDEVCLESEDSKAIDDSTSHSSSATSHRTTVDRTMVCKWTNCDWPGSYDDLVDHIREIHVELQPYHNHQHIVASTSSPFSAISATSDQSPARESSTSCSPSASQQQQYVCLWEGCKVYGKGSLSRSWLERHVLQHSGPRPFKCIFEGCGARFKARSALERHVNAHFNGSLNETGGKDVPCCGESTDASNELSFINNNSSNIHEGPMMMRAKGANGTMYSNCPHSAATSSSSGTPNKLYKRKKVNKVKRRCVNLKSNQDYFDVCIMEHLKYSLYQLNAMTGIDIAGSQRNITFHSKVIARRRENKTGVFDALLHYEPEDILPDIWVPESDMEEFSTRIIPITSLPCEALAKLMEISQIRSPGRKQKRK